MENVIIIGTGCAGLTAAIYTGRANLKPLVLTGEMPGGLLTTTSIVENYPGFPEGIDGFQLMSGMQKQAERFGATVKFGNVEAVDLSARPFKVTIDGEVKETQSIIIATGSSHRKLGLEGERALENKGVTYCATCDGALPMFRDKPLVVVGGGDSACEEAMYLTRFGSKVYLIHRRDELRASRIMADRTLANPKIEPIWDTVVEEINGGNLVESVTVKNLKTGETRNLECVGVFVAIGHVPNTTIFKGDIGLNEEGYVIPEKSGGAINVRTNVEGVFVSGDVTDSTYRQAITAAGTGCAAAIEAERFLASLESHAG